MAIITEIIGDVMPGNTVVVKGTLLDLTASLWLHGAGGTKTQQTITSMSSTEIKFVVSDVGLPHGTVSLRLIDTLGAIVLHELQLMSRRQSLLSPFTSETLN